METYSMNLNKERELGEVIGDAFEFIRQEFKRLSTAILYYVVPILIIAAIILVYVNIEQQKYIRELANRDPYYNIDQGPFALIRPLFKFYFYILLCYSLALTSIKCLAYGYLKLYVEKGKDGFDLNDILNQIKKTFFPVLGISIIVSIIVIVGAMLCLIPGIYLGVSLSLIYAVFILENKGFGDAFSRSFQLTGMKWWNTLLLIIIAGLIVGSLSFILQIPGMLLGFGSSLFNPQEWTQLGEITTSSRYLIINSVVSVLVYILYIIPPFILGFQYFNLREIKEKPSLQDKIQQIGESDSEE